MKKLTKDKGKKIIFQFLTNLALVFLFLFFLEILVRFLLPQLGMSKDIRVPDPVLHHSFIPGSETMMNSQEFKVYYKINKFGLRDKEIEPKKPGVFRILVLGDSVVEGWGVELKDSWVKQLEKNLNENFGEGKFEVINGGVASYSPLLYYLFLKGKGLKLQPDLVIMMMDMGDPSDDYAYTKLASLTSSGEPMACPGGYYREKGAKKFFSRTSFFLRRYSHLYLLLDYLLFVASDSEGKTAGGLRPMLFDIKKAKSWDEAWRLSQKYILLTKSLLAKEKIPLVFSVAPPAFLVGESEWQKGREIFGFNLKGIDFDKYFRQFRAFSQNNKVFYIELLTHLRNFSEHPLYYSYDIHPNPRGHKVIADCIFEELIKGGFLEEVVE